MVLLIEGTAVQTPDPETLLKESSFLREKALAFNPPGQPPQLVDKTTRCLYVAQKEMLAIRTDEEINGRRVEMVGSEDATTCHIVLLILRTSSTSTVAAIAHLDSCDESDFEDFEMELRRVGKKKSPEPIELDTYIIGGYQDERGLSGELSSALLLYMIHSLHTTFNLQLCYVGSANTQHKDKVAWPRVYGVAYCLSTGSLTPARFSCHGPDTDIRSLRGYSSLSGLMSLYNSSSGRLVIPPFNYTPFCNAHLWLQASDDCLLSKCSTSPLVEPPNFCDQLRKTFRRMITDPNPLESIFKGHRAREYERDEGSGDWRLLHPEQFHSESVHHAAAHLTVQQFMAAMRKS